MKKIINSKQGVSLTEILIVMLIAASLLIASYIAYISQIGKGRDGKRRDDLERVRVAFENYFNDTGCYPAATVLDNCGDSFPPGADKPYLQHIPCDPESNEPYQVFVQQVPCPSWYLVLANMEYLPGLSNPCRDGCSFEDGEVYYYYIGSNNVSPWEIDQFANFGDPEEICPVEEVGCFMKDDEGECNSSEGCNRLNGQFCFSAKGCPSGCEIESCTP